MLQKLSGSIRKNFGRDSKSQAGQKRKGWGRVGGHERSRKEIKSWVLEFPGLVQF